MPQMDSARPSARISIPQVTFMMPRAKFITNTSHVLPTTNEET
jgi:hypothetical protein